MSRTTTSKLILAAAVCAAAAWAGCSKRYPREELARNGPIGQQVRGMAATLQEVGPEGMDTLYERQAASGLTPQQERSLRAAMVQIAKAQEVEVQDLARFGKNVYRVSLRLRSAGGTSSEVCMLLVRADGGLRWAGQN